MAETLDVYLCDALVGHLVQQQGELSFGYTTSWLENPAAIPLSQSLPLRNDSFSFAQCRGFFAGILPEESKRDLIARNLGISSKNDFMMLEQIGGECAGAVTFMPAGALLPKPDYRYRALSDNELAKLLEELPRRPLLAGDNDIRLSLAGAQDKIAVHIDDGKISLPLGGAPSTHIIKPANERFDGLVFNECFCMHLSKAVGLPVATTEIGRVGSIQYLLVERYDRTIAQTSKGSTTTQRAHQEDFCQALGIVSEMKYQREGGPSLKQCFDLLREASDNPVKDLSALLDVVIFNFLIGNHDAHGKNFSLLYGVETLQARTTRLAPFYDLLSTVYYSDLTRKMAMKIGDEYDSAKLLPKNFERMASEVGLAKPIVKKRVPELARSIVEHMNNIEIDHRVVREIKALISKRCETAIRDFGE